MQARGLLLSVLGTRNASFAAGADHSASPACLSCSLNLAEECQGAELAAAVQTWRELAAPCCLLCPAAPDGDPGDTFEAVLDILEASPAAGGRPSAAASPLPSPPLPLGLPAHLSFRPAFARSGWLTLHSTPPLLPAQAKSCGYLLPAPGLPSWHSAQEQPRQLLAAPLSVVREQLERQPGAHPLLAELQRQAAAAACAAGQQQALLVLALCTDPPPQQQGRPQRLEAGAAALEETEAMVRKRSRWEEEEEVVVVVEEEEEGEGRGKKRAAAQPIARLDDRQPAARGERHKARRLGSGRAGVGEAEAELDAAVADFWVRLAGGRAVGLRMRHKCRAWWSQAAAQGQSRRCCAAFLPHRWCLLPSLPCPACLQDPSWCLERRCLQVLQRWGQGRPMSPVTLLAQVRRGSRRGESRLPPYLALRPGDTAQEVFWSFLQSRPHLFDIVRGPAGILPVPGELLAGRRLGSVWPQRLRFEQRCRPDPLRQALGPGCGRTLASVCGRGDCFTGRIAAAAAVAGAAAFLEYKRAVLDELKEANLLRRAKAT